MGLFTIAGSRVGVSQAQLYEDRLREMVRLEELGFSSYFVGEHHFHTMGTISNTLVFLAAAAQRTTRIRLGAGVVVLPQHHPIRVAEEAALVDCLSGGRLDLGVGTGSPYGQLEGFGIAAAERNPLFEESLEVIRLALTHTRVTYSGKRYTFNNLPIVATPVQRPHPPIWQSTERTEHAVAAARAGDSLLLRSAGAPPEVLGDVIKAFKEAAAAAGHTRSRVGVTAQVYLALSPGEVEQGLGQLRAHYGDLTNEDPLNPDGRFHAPAELSAMKKFLALSVPEIRQKYAVGTPDEFIERARRLQELAGGGIDLLLAQPHFDHNDESLAQTLDLLARKVAPAIAARPSVVA